MQLKESLCGIVGDENVFDSPEDLEPEGGYKSYEFWVDGQRTAIDDHQYTAMLGSISVEGLTGAAFGPNYGPLMDKVRQALDPNEVSDPPHNTHD